MAKRKKTAQKIQDNTPVEPDDGTRWIIVHKGTRQSPYHWRNGTVKSQAERLSRSLLADTEILQLS